jgi:hypothetical protein
VPDRIDTVMQKMEAAKLESMVDCPSSESEL